VDAHQGIDYAKFRSRSHDAVIRVYDDAGNVIETHEHVKSQPRLEVVSYSAVESSPLKGKSCQSPRAGPSISWAAALIWPM